MSATGDDGDRVIIIIPRSFIRHSFGPQGAQAGAQAGRRTWALERPKLGPMRARDFHGEIIRPSSLGRYPSSASSRASTRDWLASPRQLTIVNSRRERRRKPHDGGPESRDLSQSTFLPNGKRLLCSLARSPAKAGERASERRNERPKINARLSSEQTNSPLFPRRCTSAARINVYRRNRYTPSISVVSPRVRFVLPRERRPVPAKSSES